MAKYTLNDAQTTSLVEGARVSYNRCNFVPTAAVFKVTPDQIKTEVLKFVREYINDAAKITLDINYKSGEIGAFVWIPSNSANVTDTSTMNERSAIKRPIIRYSNELKDFMDKFCSKENKRAYQDNNGLPLVGVAILLERVFDIIFDKQGFKYSKEFNVNTKSRTRLEARAHFAKADGNGFGKLRYIEVTKSIDSDLAQREPTPRRAAKI